MQKIQVVKFNEKYPEIWNLESYYKDLLNGGMSDCQCVYLNVFMDDERTIRVSVKIPLDVNIADGRVTISSGDVVQYYGSPAVADGFKSFYIRQSSMEEIIRTTSMINDRSRVVKLNKNSIKLKTAPKFTEPKIRSNRFEYCADINKIFPPDTTLAEYSKSYLHFLREEAKVINYRTYAPVIDDKDRVRYELVTFEILPEELLGIVNGKIDYIARNSGVFKGHYGRRIQGTVLPFAVILDDGLVNKFKEIFQLVNKRLRSINQLANQSIYVRTFSDGFQGAVFNASRQSGRKVCSRINYNEGSYDDIFKVLEEI